MDIENKDKRVYFALQESEAEIIQAAGGILSAMIAREGIFNDNEDEMIKRSVKIAIKMARYCDDIIKSDEEK